MRALAVLGLLLVLVASAGAEVLPDVRSARGKARVSLNPGTRQLPIAGQKGLKLTVKPNTHAEVSYEAGKGGVIRSATIKLSQPVDVQGSQKLVSALGITPQGRFLRLFQRAATVLDPTIHLTALELKSEGDWVDTRASGSVTAFGITAPIPGVTLRLGQLSRLLRPDALDGPMMSALHGLMGSSQVELAAELNGSLLQLGQRGPLSVKGTLTARPSGRGITVSSGELHLDGALRGKLNVSGELELPGTAPPGPGGR